MKLFVRAAVLLGICGSGAFATPLLCTSFEGLTAATLQSLGSTGCQFGDKIFYNFTYDYNLQNSLGNPFAGDANTPLVTAASVLVQFSNLGGDPLHPVLSLVSNWQVSNGNSGDIAVHYQVSAPLTAQMYFSSVGAFGQLTNTDPINDFAPYISVAETVCCPGGSAKGLGLQLDAPAVTSPLTSVSSFDSTYYPLTTVIQVSKDVFISAGTGRNIAILTQIDEGLAEAVPEPLGALLMGSGLIALGLVGAKRKPKK